MKTWKFLALLLAGTLALAGSASAATDMEAVLRRLEVLEKGNVQLQRENAVLRDRVQRLEGGRVVRARPEPIGTPVSAEPTIARSHAPIARMPQFAWTGFNVGVFSGYSLGGVWKGDVPDYPHLPVNGWLGGVSVGYDQQFGNLVVGVEADLAAADIKLTENYFDAAVALRLDWLSTVRARIGHAWGRNMIYATGGLALGHLNFVVNHWGTPPGSEVFQASADGIHFGYAVGGGVQRQLADNAIFKVEYLWVDLGEKTYSLATPPTFTGISTNRFGWSGHIMKAGINWQFD